MTDKEKNDAANDMMSIANFKGGMSTLVGGRRTRLGKQLSKESHEIALQAIDLVQGPLPPEIENMSDEELFKSLS